MKTIGIMTGNSLDAVDCVITEFDGGKIRDTQGLSREIPLELADSFRRLKGILKDNRGDIRDAVKKMDFQTLHDGYIRLVADTCKELLEKAELKPGDIEIAGFHGQTCYHLPPSLAKNKNDVKTIQIGSGQKLSDLLGIPVAFDFRSDDIFNGGEGAPLAPVHNLHLARSIGTFPLVFLNAGNTGNIAVVSSPSQEGIGVSGFDVGPCNHFIDLLCRTERGLPCDVDGNIGKTGKINEAFFNRLYASGKKFYDKKPPKSSDPAWYELPAPQDGISFEDKIRTLEHFSAFLFVDALKFIPKQLLPKQFLLFGGGWQNPVVREDFQKLLKEKIPDAEAGWSDACGFSGKYMEARIFADAARCRLENVPFTFPETTGCKTPTVCGIIAEPGGGNTQLFSRAA